MLLFPQTMELSLPPDRGASDAGHRGAPVRHTSVWARDNTKHPPHSLLVSYPKSRDLHRRFPSLLDSSPPAIFSSFSPLSDRDACPPPGSAASPSGSSS